jgi:Beta-glucosidase/6-phospho-beta-glucosidase/beta-galactosidase
MTDLLTRRTLMTAAAVATGGLLAAPGLVAAPKKFSFPKGFRWGAATAAHQVEGNNVNSDAWLLEHLPRSPFLQPSGDACDHYHLFEDDIALVARLGLNTYRFSVEWARIEPSPGQFSMAELRHYGRMLDCCKRHGLTTVVTLHHFTSPLWFAKHGGFENPEAPQALARYAAKVVEVLGDRIDWLCTINEANGPAGSLPPAKLMAQAAAAAGSERFSYFQHAGTPEALQIIRDCHVAMCHAIAAVRPGLQTGYTLALPDLQDAPGESGFAEEVRQRTQAPFLELARNDAFVGVQTYTRDLYGSKGRLAAPRDKPLTQTYWEYYPQALGNTVRYAAQYARVPVFVTENGIASADDARRVSYIDEALVSLAASIKSGIDVRGYLYWSLLDNFEWFFGYKPQFGLIAVDRSNQKRTVKPSALHLGQIARTNAISSI